MANKPKAAGTAEETANKSWLDYWRIADALADLKRLPEKQRADIIAELKKRVDLEFLREHLG